MQTCHFRRVRQKPLFSAIGKNTVAKKRVCNPELLAWHWSSYLPSAIRTCWFLVKLLSIHHSSASRVPKGLARYKAGKALLHLSILVFVLIWLHSTQNMTATTLSRTYSIAGELRFLRSQLSNRNRSRDQNLSIAGAYVFALLIACLHLQCYQFRSQFCFRI